MSGEALLEAIYAAPDELSARAVYADWLLDRGDPRGELITLQLRDTRTEAQEARARELVDAHAEAWTGKLTEITTWIEFDRGFLARCGLARIPKWVIGRREWATVSHIGISDDWSRDIAPLVTHEVMRSLASLRLPSRAFTALLGSAHTARLPASLLTIDGNVSASAWKALEEAPLFAPLRELEVRGTVEAAPQISASRFARVRFTVGGWVVTWTRGGDDRLSALAVESGVVRYGGKLDPVHLSNYFKALPADVVSAIDLRAVEGQVGMGAVKHALARQIRIVDDL